MSEDELLGSTVALAEYLHILVFHVRDSRTLKIGQGFPDLVLAGSAGVIFAELKGFDDVLSSAQKSWKWKLQAGGAHWQLWRPPDWFTGRIEHELRRIA